MSQKDIETDDLLQIQNDMLDQISEQFMKDASKTGDTSKLGFI
jgi:hypothetical protein